MVGCHNNGPAMRPAVHSLRRVLIIVLGLIAAEWRLRACWVVVVFCTQYDTLIDVADHCLGEKAVGVGPERVVDADSTERYNYGMHSQWARLTGVHGAVMCVRG